MKERAIERGATIEVKLVTEGEMDGWISAKYSDQEKPTSWFMAVTDHCVC
jgi:hypothetical protein